MLVGAYLGTVSQHATCVFLSITVACCSSEHVVHQPGGGRHLGTSMVQEEHVGEGHSRFSAQFSCLDRPTRRAN